MQLSPLEFGVLATLSERPGRAVTRAELIERSGARPTSAEATSWMSSCAASARNSVRSPNRVETARGVGYRLK